MMVLGSQNPQVATSQGWCFTHGSRQTHCFQQKNINNQEVKSFSMGKHRFLNNAELVLNSPFFFKGKKNLKAVSAKIILWV